MNPMVGEVSKLLRRIVPRLLFFLSLYHRRDAIDNDTVGVLKNTRSGCCLFIQEKSDSLCVRMCSSNATSDKESIHERHCAKPPSRPLCLYIACAISKSDWLCIISMRVYDSAVTQTNRILQYEIRIYLFHQF